MFSLNCTEAYCYNCSNVYAMIRYYNLKVGINVNPPLSLLPEAFHLMESCASLMWFYGFSNNVADLRLSVATNAWNSSMSLYLSSQVSHPTKCFIFQGLIF